jgi:hypothetical protein
MSTTISTITQYGYAYLVSSICGFGIVCNIINLTVLVNRRLKESPYTYLTALATFDILTLLFTLSITFTRSQSLFFDQITDIYVEYTLAKLEKLFFLPCANLFSPMSVVIIVALTVERFLFTKYPMKAKNFCVPKYAYKVILILFACVLLFRVPMFLFYDIKIIKLNSSSHLNFTSSDFDYLSFSDISDLCLSKNALEIICKIKIENNYEKFQDTYLIVSFVLFQIIPVFILSTLNLKLILMVRKSVNNSKNLRKISLLVNDSMNLKLRKKSTVSRDRNFNQIRRKSSNKVNTSLPIRNKRFQSQSIISTSSCKSISERLDREQVKLTRTLIAVTCFELLSELSSIITYDKIANFLMGRNYMKNGYHIQKLISMTIVVTSHSVNFFLYCAFNTRYLGVLKNLYCCNRQKNMDFKRKNRKTSQRITTFQMPPA